MASAGLEYLPPRKTRGTTVIGNSDWDAICGRTILSLPFPSFSLGKGSGNWKTEGGGGRRTVRPSPTALQSAGSVNVENRGWITKGYLIGVLLSFLCLDYPAPCVWTLDSQPKPQSRLATTFLLVFSLFVIPSTDEQIYFAY